MIFVISHNLHLVLTGYIARHFSDKKYICVYKKSLEPVRTPSLFIGTWRISAVVRLFRTPVWCSFVFNDGGIQKFRINDQN